MASQRQQRKREEEDGRSRLRKTKKVRERHDGRDRRKRGFLFFGTACRFSLRFFTVRASLPPLLWTSPNNPLATPTRVPF